MKTFRSSLALATLAAIASVGNLHAQQTTTQPINQRDGVVINTRENQNPHQAAVPLKQAIVKNLQKANEAEIELAKRWQ